MILKNIEALRSEAATSTLVLVVVLALAAGTSLRAQTAVIVDTQNAAVLNDVASAYTQFRSPVTIEQSNGYDLSDRIQLAADSLVVIQSYDTPDLQSMNEALNSLAEQGQPTTFMVFVNQADDYDWTSELNQPDNVKLAIAVRSQDQIAVADVYSSIGSSYDGSRVGYDYSQAVRMAVEQLSAIGQSESGVSTIKPWAADRSDMFFDGYVLYSGAPTEDAAELMSHFDANHSFSEVDWTQANGVHGGDVLLESTSGDMPIIWAETVLGECSGSQRWDGMIENEISFQSFGTIDLR
ncbi:hypothetical protein ACERZ8_03425 [Tateyamaria armeniaca]|uniref:Uncharacterized protein n=1 Tax=Tateyamaria armeniaca TaxID=2518930 RepID=A0ABW8USC7_9RHOB